MFAECGVYLPTSQIRFHYEFAKLSLDFTLSDVDQRPAIQAKIEAVRTKYAKMLVLCLIVKMGHTLEDLYIVGTIADFRVRVLKKLCSCTHGWPEVAGSCSFVFVC